MTAWRTVFTYNKYAQITARALRASLKEEERVVAEKRGLTASRYQKWENGLGGLYTTVQEEVQKK
ncbi:hypothetical protein M413DRAFT_31692 [Hebeloma cylindrosporum]|uniref:ATP synthase subunit epsilon, mitochondrial n=1 Tax=Hebeloma cylindrosporum TaxID=76867 RepID=A0A0C3BWK6_HEBCY|nr:hypothetical protein M413DRAFT_31692 [Hebeloma cylindrosporum h7]